MTETPKEYLKRMKKNKAVSMSSFQIVCKRVEEQDKQIQELKQEIKQLKASADYKTFLELKKENERLRKYETDRIKKDRVLIKKAEQERIISWIKKNCESFEGWYLDIDARTMAEAWNLLAIKHNWEERLQVKKQR